MRPPRAPAPRRGRAPVVALAVALAALAAFTLLALAVNTGNATLAAWDAGIGRALAVVRGTPVGQALAGLSAVHAPRGIAALTALAALGLALLRRRAEIAPLLASVLGGATLNHLLKHGIQRPRPGLEQALGVATDFSFPSGHVANATLLYGTLAALVLVGTRSRLRAAGAVALALLLVGAVACSRVVLGAHHPSDVVAGMLVGLAWTAACVAAFEALRRSG